MKNRLWKQLIETPLQLIELVGRAIAAPFSSMGRMFSRGIRSFDEAVQVSRSRNPELTFWGRTLRLLGRPFKIVFGWLAKLLSFPFVFVRHLFGSARGEVLWCLPAVVTLTLLAFVFFRVFFQESSIVRTYRVGALEAMKTGDFDLARTYNQRLVSWPGESDDFDRLNWALSLVETGEVELGQQILSDLAPNDSAGFPPAHRMRALGISQQLQRTSKPELREPLRWHLKHSNNQEAEEIQTAWALYYVETGQLSKALPYLKNAAKQNPAHHLTIARVHASRGDSVSWQNSMTDAENGFRSRLKEDSLSHPTRIALALAVARQDRNDEAERLLLQGMKLNADATMKRALADFYLMQHDQSDSFEDQLALIQKSLKLDINYLPAYERIISQFQKAIESDPQQADKIEEMLLSSIAGGETTALAHFSMSNVKAIRGDNKQARWHLERAYALEPKFSVIANNLAWLLAHDEENPDLDRAYELAKDVVDRNPNVPEMRDTLATILMKQEKYEEALTHFEMILGKIQNVKPVHEKLAFIYEKLQNTKLAKKHAAKASIFEK